MTFSRFTLPALLTITLLPIGLSAQTPTLDFKSSDCSKLPTHPEQAECEESHSLTKTIPLKYITSQNDANEIMVAVRNMLDPGLKIYLVAYRNALVIKTYPEQIARAETLIASLDRPHKTYRLTYTITELDAGKTLGTQHLSMIVVSGQHSSAKEGDKIPIATGSSAASDNSAAQTQFQYLDIGMNIDATLNDYDTGAVLKTKVEQSSISQTSTIAGVTEPVIRQTVLEGNTLLTLGKPVMLGSIDVPNSTHHLDIAVVAEPIH